MYALKYAERDGRRSEHFLGGDPHDGPMPMDYLVWAAVGGGHGCRHGLRPADAAARGRRLVRSTTEALATVGVDASTVTDVVLTHLHYDHGRHRPVPQARFHVQNCEMAFATGRHMTKATLNHPFTADHVSARARRYARRVAHDGDDGWRPGSPSTSSAATPPVCRSE